MILASLLVVGFSLTEATTEVRVRSAARPTVGPAPRVPAGEEIGRGEHLDIERANDTQVEPTPAAPENSCDDLSVLVDRSHTLPPRYAPDDLVSLSEYNVPTLGSEEMLLRHEAAGHLRRLVKDAAADGEELVVASAYRSYAHQGQSYARLTSIYGAEAGEMSARPGHSQHQLGTAVDFTNAAAGYEIWDYFGETSAYQWLKDHAREYGFALAYPSGKDAETGYQWEPWHYRYVGTQNAKHLEESGLSLQEFLTREGVLPRC